MPGAFGRPAPGSGNASSLEDGGELPFPFTSGARRDPLARCAIARLPERNRRVARGGPRAPRPGVRPHLPAAASSVRCRRRWKTDPSSPVEI
jgi:hypothetical protein